VHELVELSLRIQVALGLQHELTDVVLEVVGQLHVLHRGVRDVDLFLKPLRFTVESLHENGDCPEDVRVDQGAHDQQQAGKAELHRSIRGHVVA